MIFWLLIIVGGLLCGLAITESTKIYYSDPIWCYHVQGLFWPKVISKSEWYKLDDK